MPRKLTIATLSFAKNGDAMVLPPGERLRAIVEAVMRLRPTILVTAGYAVDTIHELSELSQALRRHSLRTLIITEVHRETTTPKLEVGRHAMWAVVAGSAVLHRFGMQCFGRSCEVRRPDCQAVMHLRVQMPMRIYTHRSWKILALICGELNIVQGRERPRFICPVLQAQFEAADIIVNPTHDRMANAGTLQAKRAFLSQPQGVRPRIYVSCSNWDIAGGSRGVQRPSPSLHTVYRNGLPLTYAEHADGRHGHVLRMWQVPGNNSAQATAAGTPPG